ncbi:hypothetical protein JCM11251_000720 [Rhodosporidiobolus azoricus]
MPFFAIPDYQLCAFVSIFFRHQTLEPPGSNVLGWSRQINHSRLADRFQFLLVDCPFHGFTRAEPRPTHTLEDSANCIVALLDHLDIPSFVLYGEGVHGVNVATWTAIKRKEKVQGILLASPGWRSEEPSVQQSLKDVESAMFVNKNGNGDGSGSLPEEAAEDILCYCVGGAQRMAGTRKEMAKYFQSRYGTGKPDFEMRFLFTFVWDRKPIPDEQLASLTCPILMLRGGDDGIVCPERAVEEWQAAFLNAKGGAEIHVISGAPAVMSLSDGNVVSRLMGQFFSKCTGAS